MKDIAGEIRAVVRDAAGALALIDPQRVAVKKGPDRWSKKEILGHLIDSAANNHHRFVRGAYNAASDFPPYRQDDWVRVQQYNASDWSALITLWSAYNLHLCDIIERLPEEALSAPCNLGREEPVSISFVIRDYLRHLRHHLEVLLDE